MNKRLFIHFSVVNRGVSLFEEVLTRRIPASDHISPEGFCGDYRRLAQPSPKLLDVPDHVGVGNLPNSRRAQAFVVHHQVAGPTVVAEPPSHLVALLHAAVRQEKDATGCIALALIFRESGRDLGVILGVPQPYQLLGNGIGLQHQLLPDLFQFSDLSGADRDRPVQPQADHGLDPADQERGLAEAGRQIEHVPARNAPVGEPGHNNAGVEEDVPMLGRELATAVFECGDGQVASQVIEQCEWIGRLLSLGERMHPGDHEPKWGTASHGRMPPLRCPPAALLRLRAVDARRSLRFARLAYASGQGRSCG